MFHLIVTILIAQEYIQ